MTDTKPTLEETIADHENELASICGDGPNETDWKNHVKVRIKFLKELQSIRSAELPVGPVYLPQLREYLHNVTSDVTHVSCGIGNLRDVLNHIDALKSYALKEKERADTWDALYKEQWQRAEKAESELATRNESLAEANRLLSLNVAEVKRLTVDLLACELTKKGLATLLDSKESELAALRGRMMEPDEEMIKAAALAYEKSPCHDLIGSMEDAVKAMSAVALKEGK